MEEINIYELIKVQNNNIKLLSELLDIANERITNLYEHILKRPL